MGSYSDPALILPGAVGQTELAADSKKNVVNGVAGLDASTKITSRLAYEDVANGVAKLDASGNLLVPADRIYLVRDESDQIWTFERTSGESVEYTQRVGANQYDKYIANGGWQLVQHNGHKDAASGIAGLNASSHLNLSPCASGTYAGDGSANKAIAHGLGRVPKFIILTNEVNATSMRIVESGKIHGLSEFGHDYLAVTAPTSTNFYVGNATSYPYSANNSVDTYNWVGF